MVLETSTLVEKVKVNRRKENISDIKFSPGNVEVVGDENGKDEEEEEEEYVVVF